MILFIEMKTSDDSFDSKCIQSCFAGFAICVINNNTARRFAGLKDGYTTATTPGPMHMHTFGRIFAPRRPRLFASNF